MSRRSWLAAGLALPLCRLRAADEFSVRFDGDNLYPIAPTVHFLVGKPLERLKNGNTVGFVSQLTLLTDERQTVVKKSPPEKFILSRDIWNETFKVTMPNTAPHDKIGLTAGQAEAWCLDNMAISPLGVPAEAPLWLRFDLWTVRDRDYSSVFGDNKLSIWGLVEYVSRRVGADDLHLTHFTSRFRLLDLPRQLFGRGSRSG